MKTGKFTRGIPARAWTRWVHRGPGVVLAVALCLGVAAGQAADAPAGEAESAATPAPASEAARSSWVGELINAFADSELPAGRRADMVVTVLGNSHIAGDVDDVCVTVVGDARVTGRVGSECVTVFGDLDLDGVVGGEVVVFMGTARLGPNAVVNGDTLVVGGRLHTDPGARLHGQKLQLFGFLASVGDWFRQGLLLGRPLPPRVGWVWVIVGLHFLMYLLVAMLLARPVEACEQTLDRQVLVAFGVGLLGVILAAPLGFVLLASGLGLLVLPIVAVAGMAALVIGKAAWLQWIGRSLYQRLSRTGKCPPLSGFVVGFALVTLLYLVPLVGFAVYALSIPLAFGAVLLAMINAMRSGASAGPPSAVVPVTPTPTPTGGVAPHAVPTGPAPAFVMPAPGEGGPPGSSSSSASLAASPAAADSPAGPAPPSSVQPPGTPVPVAGVGPTPGRAPSASAAELASLPRAGFWLRAGAAALDLVLLGWLFAPLPGPLVGPFFVLVLIAYHTAMWAWKGTTLGGIVCGLKVIRADGRPLDWTVALVRALAAVFSALPLFLGFFWVGWSAERQSWHDKIAGTLIVRVPKGVSLI